MLWLAWFALAHPVSLQLGNFWKVLPATVAALLALCLVSCSNSRHPGSQPKNSMALQEVEILDLAQKLTSRNSYQLIGRIKNVSADCTLEKFRIRNTMRDVMPNHVSEIIGQTEALVYQAIPPMQTREIDLLVYYKGMPEAKGHYEWHCEIVEVKGGQTEAH